jgi:hypothetical protein
MALIPLLFAFIVEACNQRCNTLCQKLNGKISCFEGCGCTPMLKSEEKNSLQELNGFNIISVTPPHLWTAVQPVALKLNNFNSGKFNQCGTCLYLYSSENYYECVYWNCRQSIHEKSQFINKIQKKNLTGLSYDEKIDYIWFYYRKDLLDKSILFKEFYVPELDQANNDDLCKDCESLVYADDYYNCVLRYCRQATSKISLFNNTIQVSGLCSHCKDLEESYYQCVSFYCKDEVLTNAYKDTETQAKLTKCEDCKYTTDGNYDNCRIYYCEEKTSVPRLLSSEEFYSADGTIQNAKQSYEIATIAIQVCIFISIILISLYCLKSKKKTQVKDPYESEVRYIILN